MRMTITSNACPVTTTWWWWSQDKHLTEITITLANDKMLLVLCFFNVVASNHMQIWWPPVVNILSVISRMFYQLDTTKYGNLRSENKFYENKQRFNHRISIGPIKLGCQIGHSMGKLKSVSGPLWVPITTFGYDRRS